MTLTGPLILPRTFTILLTTVITRATAEMWTAALVVGQQPGLVILRPELSYRNYQVCGVFSFQNLLARIPKWLCAVRRGLIAHLVSVDSTSERSCVQKCGIECYDLAVA